MSATVIRDGDRLRITYELRNRGATPVLVFDGVPEADGPGKQRVDPQAVYVTARGGDTVEVAKRVFAVPDGLNPEAYARLRATVLPAGDAVAEQLTVPLPPRARHPYRDDDLPGRVTQVVFCVGAAPAAAVTQKRPATESTGAAPSATANGGERYWVSHERANADVQHLFCSEPHRL